MNSIDLQRFIDRHHIQAVILPMDQQTNTMMQLTPTELLRVTMAEAARISE